MAVVNAVQRAGNPGRPAGTAAYVRAGGGQFSVSAEEMKGGA